MSSYPGRSPKRRSAIAPLVGLSVVVAFSGLIASFAPSAGAATARPTASLQTQCGSTNASVNPQLSVDRATVPKGDTTVVTVKGTNFLVPPHQCGKSVFGGVYVFFGWAQPGGQWGPSFRNSTSANGLFGSSYSYPGEGGDGEVRDDGSGTVRLVSFTAGGESGEATDFHMDANGNWQTQITVRGSTYSFKNLLNGQSSTVDCTVVQCGVFTIGAHGKASRTNERFTPINFTDAAGAPIAPSAPASGGAGGVSGAGDANAGVGAPSGGAATPQVGSDGAPVAAGETPPTTGAAETSDEAVGTVGESSEVADESSDAEESESDDEAVDGERASAAVFEGDSSGGSGGMVAIVVAVIVLLAAVAGVVLLRRRGPSDAAVKGAQ